MKIVKIMVLTMCINSFSWDLKIQPGLDQKKKISPGFIGDGLMYPARDWFSDLYVGIYFLCILMALAKMTINSGGAVVLVSFTVYG